MTDSLFSLAGKTALVAGASSGLGEHFSKVLAAAGAQVVACGCRKQNLDRVVGDITESGGEAIGVIMDVTNRQCVVSAMEEAEKQFGTLSILINNAGIARSSLFTKTDEASWQATMDTNLDGVWRVAQEYGHYGKLLAVLWLAHRFRRDCFFVYRHKNATKSIAARNERSYCNNKANNPSQLS